VQELEEAYAFYAQVMDTNVPVWEQWRCSFIAENPNPD
jgi:hypothetical protein